MNNPDDLAYLEMAYGLAEKARGWASPNPYVGAVVVNGPKIVGLRLSREAGDAPRRDQRPAPGRAGRPGGARCT